MLMLHCVEDRQRRTVEDNKWITRHMIECGACSAIAIDTMAAAGPRPVILLWKRELDKTHSTVVLSFSAMVNALWVQL